MAAVGCPIAVSSKVSFSWFSRADRRAALGEPSKQQLQALTSNDLLHAMHQGFRLRRLSSSVSALLKDLVFRVRVGSRDAGDRALDPGVPSSVSRTAAWATGSPRSMASPGDDPVVELVAGLGKAIPPACERRMHSRTPARSSKCRVLPRRANRQGRRRPHRGGRRRGLLSRPLERSAPARPRPCRTRRGRCRGAG
jgi:hypothetical protein